MMKMKNIIQISFVILLLAWVASCGKDNYDAPESTLTGQLVYNGKPIQVRGTSEAVQLQLFQDNWPNRNAIAVYVTQDGSFTAKLFDGEYKLVTRDRNGPWENTRDTTVINLKGSFHLDLNVTPFFVVSDARNISTANQTLSASLDITQVVSSAQLERVYLILSKTQFADEVHNLIRKDITGVAPGNNISLSVNLSEAEVTNINNAPTLFGRIGVKTSGTDQAIWTPVVKLK